MDSSAEGALALAIDAHKSQTIAASSQQLDETERLSEVRLTADRGHGLFATRDIKRGTCIVNEAPIFTFPPDIARYDKHGIHLMLAGFEKLDPEQLQALMQLSSDHPEFERCLKERMGDDFKPGKMFSSVEEMQKALCIYKSNCVRLGFQGQHGSGVFLKYSRLNHSCTPNVSNIYDEFTRKEVVHVTRDVKADEEFTTTYIDLLAPPSVRAMELKKWSFVCTCAACVGPGVTASRRRRERMARVNKTLAVECAGDVFGTSLPRADPAHALASAEELMRLCKEEGLIGSYLYMAYGDCVKYCRRLGDYEKALAYAKEELKIERICYGASCRPQDSAVHQVAGLSSLIQQRRIDEKAARREEKRKVKEMEEKTAYEEGRKEWEAAKKVTKKDKRTVKAAAEKVEMVKEQREALVAGLDAVGLARLAFRLRGETDVAYLRTVLDGERERLGIH